jgi:hypothetical protein
MLAIGRNRHLVGEIEARHPTLSVEEGLGLLEIRF